MTSSARGGHILRSSPWARVATASVLVAISLAALLAVMADLAVARKAGGVAYRLGGDATVVVWSHGLESADAAAARASEVLAKIPGVAQARWLDPDPGDVLVAAVLGAPGEADVRLIQVTAPGDGPRLAKRMVGALADQALPARAVSRSISADLGLVAPFLAAAILVPLAGILAFAIVGWIEARREMVRGRSAIDLMRASGAEEGFIVAAVRRRISGLVFVSSLWGAAGAMVAIALIGRGGPAGLAGRLTRQDLLSPWPLLILVLWLAALVGADLSVRARLKRTA